MKVDQEVPQIKEIIEQTADLKTGSTTTSKTSQDSGDVEKVPATSEEDIPSESKVDDEPETNTTIGTKSKEVEKQKEWTWSGIMKEWRKFNIDLMPKVESVANEVTKYISLYNH